MPHATGYWKFYYTFGVKRQKEIAYLIGRDRASDILVNVIFPFFLAISKCSNDMDLQNFIIKRYSSFVKLVDNKITRYFIEQVFDKKDDYVLKVDSAIRQQGLINLYKSFCANKACDICPIVNR